MEKFILGFMAAWAFTFIFTGIFYKIELSCADGSTSRKIFNIITTVMANIVWLSPFIFAIAGCLFNFITVIAALIIIVVYIIITAVIGQFLSKQEVIMERFLIFFVAAFFATFVFIGIFHKIELSCPNNSTSRKIFDCLSSLLAFLLLMSPFIFAVTGYIFGFFSLLASMIIIVVYYLIFILFGKKF